MRNEKIVLVALAAATLASLGGVSPAAAHDYPWCIQGGGWGIPGDCSYPSYGACMASASGRRVYCNINPRFAFRGARRGRAPYPY